MYIFKIKTYYFFIVIFLIGQCAYALRNDEIDFKASYCFSYYKGRVDVSNLYFDSLGNSKSKDDQIFYATYLGYKNSLSRLQAYLTRRFENGEIDVKTLESSIARQKEDAATVNACDDALKCFDFLDPIFINKNKIRDSEKKYNACLDQCNTITNGTVKKQSQCKDISWLPD